MSEPTTAPEAEPEPFRVPDENPDDLASTLAKTIDEVRHHGVILDRLAAEPDPATALPAAGGAEPAPAAEHAAYVLGEANGHLRIGEGPDSLPTLVRTLLTRMEAAR